MVRDDPYIEGLQALGQKCFERERSPDREVSKSPFSGMMPHDRWQSRLLESQTIRSKKSIQASMNFATKGVTVYNIPFLPEQQSEEHTVDLTRNTDTSTGTLEKSNV